MKAATLHQQLTFNHQLPQKQPAGKWIERFEEWLADRGFLEFAADVTGVAVGRKGRAVRNVFGFAGRE
jgi:hypothetical protein